MIFSVICWATNCILADATGDACGVVCACGADWGRRVSTTTTTTTTTHYYYCYNNNYYYYYITLAYLTPHHTTLHYTKHYLTPPSGPETTPATVGDV